MTCNFPGKWFTSFHTTFAPPQFEPQPRGVTFIQSNHIGDGVHGNFEAVVRVAPAIATTPDHLDFWFLDSRTSVWNGPLALVADGKPMDGVTGDPVLIQGNWGNQGNFELLVPRGNVIDHFFRNNDDPQFSWSLVHRLSYPTNLTPKSVTFIQSNFLGDGVHGNFAAVARVGQANPNDPDFLDFWFLDSRTPLWNGPSPLFADGKQITGVTGDPILIQGNWGRLGNFELLVPKVTSLITTSATTTTRTCRGGSCTNCRTRSRQPSLVRGRETCRLSREISLGDGVHGNFEAVVRVAPPVVTSGDHLDFWFLDSRTSQWNGPIGLKADGQVVGNVTGF
jgi:hypothetical protein